MQKKYSVVVSTIAYVLLPAMTFPLIQVPGLAQITAAPDGTNTGINQTNNTFNITGGTQAGSNLFHSFQQFGLNQGQVATFLSNPATANILGRVTGGNASVINGQVQVTGSNANLYLMNPAGIVFGANASLNVPGSFTATTANGIQMGNGGWFNAVGANNYPTLTGQPGASAFTSPQPGAVINAGNLAVGQGRDITLMGGTVLSTGTVNAAGGKVTIAAVQGGKLIRVNQAGSVLSFDLPTETRAAINPATATPQSLPALLTGGNIGNATGLTVENGTVKLTGAGTPVTLGDVVAKTITAHQATLSARNNVTLVESQIQTTGDLNVQASNTVVGRDSVAKPLVVQAGNHLTVQGDRGIDLLALNHPNPALQSGGNLSMVSNGTISGDAHYSSSGNFSMRKLDNTPGTFVSKHDPIISANGDVTFGDYNGISLKVEATGNITTGNISITGRDLNPTFAAAPAGSDRRLLNTYSTVILRAGVPALQETGAALNPSPNPPFSVPAGGTTINGSAPTPSTGRVTVGNPADPSIASIDAQYVDITAPNGITINTSVRANYVKLASDSGDVTVHSIRTDYNDAGTPGDIDIAAGGQFRATGTLNSSGFSGYATGLKNYVLVDPNLVPFIVSKTGDTTANVQAAIQASNPADSNQKMYVNAPVSISAGIGTIKIRHSGGGTTTTLSPGVTIDGGTAPFVVGPNVSPNPGDPYLPRNPASDYSTFVANPFSLDKNESYSTVTIPPGSSGTVGAITRTVVIDGSLTVATQNRVIGGTQPIIDPTTPTTPSTGPSTQPTQSRLQAQASNSSNTVNPENVQRTFISQNQNSACNSAQTTVASAGGETRSSSAVRNPCTTATDDQQILKILGEGQPQPR